MCGSLVKSWGILTLRLNNFICLVAGAGTVVPQECMVFVTEYHFLTWRIPSTSGVEWVLAPALSHPLSLSLPPSHSQAPDTGFTPSAHSQQWHSPTKETQHVAVPLKLPEGHCSASNQEVRHHPPRSRRTRWCHILPVSDGDTRSLGAASEPILVYYHVQLTQTAVGAVTFFQCLKANLPILTVSCHPPPPPRPIGPFWTP